jgi:glutamate synthase domain-containing protein 2
MFPTLNLPSDKLRQLGLHDDHIKAFENVSKMTDQMLNSRTFTQEIPDMTEAQLKQKEHNEQSIKNIEYDIQMYTAEINKTKKILNTLDHSYNTQYKSYEELENMVKYKQKEYNTESRKIENSINKKNIAERKLYYENVNMEIYERIYYLIIYVVVVLLVALIFISIANKRFKQEFIFYGAFVVLLVYLKPLIERFI